MRFGDKVNVRLFGGMVVERRFLAATDRLAYLCREEEFIPKCTNWKMIDSIGFPLCDVALADDSGHVSHNVSREKVRR